MNEMGKKSYWRRLEFGKGKRKTGDRHRKKMNRGLVAQSGGEKKWGG